MDQRGIPTAVCLECGSNIFHILATFDQKTYELDAYLLDARCANCESPLTAPTPLDAIIDE